MQSAWRTLLEHIELMPKDQDFRFQPASRLEAVAQRTDEEGSNCDHQPQACSDSLAAVTPADGVFGSDNPSGASSATSVGVGSRAPFVICRLALRRVISPQGEWH